MDINHWNGICQTTSYDKNESTLKSLYNIEIKGWTGHWSYSGMVKNGNLPHGWGRAIKMDNSFFIDAQFKDGVPHGYYR